MAEQIGPYKFRKSMGGVTGYKRNGKYFVKEKSTVTRDRVLNAPSYARTRENASEFQHASRCSMMIRRVLWMLAKKMKLADGHLSPRVNSICTKIIRTDPVNDRGVRRIHFGDIELLQDIVFRKETSFSTVCSAMASSSIDTETGAMRFSVRPFDAQERIKAPEGATHFRLVANGGAIHFDNEDYVWDYRMSDCYALDAAVDQEIRLEQSIQTEGHQYLLQAMGIIFLKAGDNGQLVEVPGGVMRVMQVCAVEATEPKTGGTETTAIIGQNTGDCCQDLDGNDGSAYGEECSTDNLLINTSLTLVPEQPGTPTAANGNGAGEREQENNLRLHTATSSLACSIDSGSQGTFEAEVQACFCAYKSSDTTTSGLAAAAPLPRASIFLKAVAGATIESTDSMTDEAGHDFAEMAVHRALAAPVVSLAVK